MLANADNTAWVASRYCTCVLIEEVRWTHETRARLWTRNQRKVKLPLEFENSCATLATAYCRRVFGRFEKTTRERSSQ